MPTIDPADHSAWRSSLRRSRARRAEALRRRRRLRGGRSGAGVVLISLTLAAGGALAAGQTGGVSASHAGGSSSPSLKVGARGAAVASLQRALRITADGVYGPQTRRAVRRFQRAHGLLADGIAGPATLRALGVSASRVRSPRASAPKSGSVSARLQRIAQCESGGNPRAVSANGQYRGKYQFSRATWRAMGGTGDPAKASEAEQDRRAAALLRRAGTSPWPNCA